MRLGLARLTAAISERIRQWKAAATHDPPRTPEVAQLLANLASTTPVDPAEEYAFDLPVELSGVLCAYLASWPPYTPALPDAFKSEAGRRLLALPPEDRVKVAIAAYRTCTSLQWGGSRGYALRRAISELLRGKLSLTDTDIIALVECASRPQFRSGRDSPKRAVLGAIERHVRTSGLSADLHGALAQLFATLTGQRTDDSVQADELGAGIAALLARSDRAGKAGVLFIPDDVWGAAVAAKLGGMSADQQAAATAMLALATKGGRNAKPAKGWLEAARQALDRPGHAQLGQHLIELITCVEPDVAISETSRETVRGLIWLAALAAPERAARPLEAFAQKTFGSLFPDLVVGNATLHAFALMPGATGAASIARLRRRLKRRNEINTLDKALAALARTQGISPAELEEIGLPDFGFAADGSLTVPVGSATAVLTITDRTSVATQWYAADGTARKAPPAEVKANHGEDIKALTARAKEIGDTLKAQRARLENLYLEEREWPLELWRARYLGEPLVSAIARRLIWSFRLGADWVAGLPQRESVLDQDGTPLPLDRSDIRVRLWHPLQGTPNDVAAWRHRLSRLDVTQPFKQAHREVYVFTDAELATCDHSNRFAGHIVQQNLFLALCRDRGWTAPAFGSWEPGESRPMKRLPAAGLGVVFLVEPVDGSLDERQYLSLYLATGQVRFAKKNEPLDLVEVPPLIFSELMRDVDLFVSIASIGTDPDYGTRPTARHAAYWAQATLGPLTETAKTRHAVLTDILPGLSIADCCRLEERFLVVTGRLRTYRIHLGSANIRMEPNNQNLCIVQDRREFGERVRLPFEGDSTLSLILSKAFLLAKDDKITDPTILSQIKHR